MRGYHLIPLVPVLAMVLMPFLPFVNTDALWFGLPRMMVWGGGWCVLLSVSLLLAERMLGRDETSASDAAGEGSA